MCLGKVLWKALEFAGFSEVWSKVVASVVLKMIFRSPEDSFSENFEEKQVTKSNKRNSSRRMFSSFTLKADFYLYRETLCIRFVRMSFRQNFPMFERKNLADVVKNELSYSCQQTYGEKKDLENLSNYKFCRLVFSDWFVWTRKSWFENKFFQRNTELKVCSFLR